MGRGLQIRLACAAALLAVGMTAVTVGAQLGVVHLNAGDMEIVFGKSEQGLTMGVASRDCARGCNFDVAWRPAQTAGGAMTAGGAGADAPTRTLSIETLATGAGR